MAGRPKRGETEEDLLKFQEQFIVNDGKPAATVVRAKKGEQEQACVTGEKRPESHSQRDVVDLQRLPQVLPDLHAGAMAPPKKKSKFKEKRMFRNIKTAATGDDNEEDAAELLERHDRSHISTVLSEIRERDTQRSQVFLPSNILQKGFPEVLHRGNISEEENKKQAADGGKISLFAQHFKASNPNSFGISAATSTTFAPRTKEVEPKAPKGNVAILSSLVSGEGLITGAENQNSAAKEVENIHKENLDRLATMSKEEILEEQARLKSSLDSGLLSFLQSRLQKKTFNKNHQEEKMETESEGIIPEQMKNSNGMSNTDDRIQNLKSEESMDLEKDGYQTNEAGEEKAKRVHFDDKVNVISQNDSEEKIVKVEELAEMASSQKWVHMDHIEPEKLEWMKDCPAPSAVRKEGGNQARFAFNGNLVTKDTEVPVNLGLHHHGDNPEAAGYTLEELFMLARSNFLQQRVVALQTLARIVSQDTQGRFCDVIQGCVLQTLLDTGIIFLLRWALDDTADAVMAVAVQCLAAVVVVPNDQLYASQVFEWHHGQELPSLRPENDEENKDKIDDDEESKHKTDAEMVKTDVIKGLLQMRILPRLRYILEVCRPSPTTVRSILSILTRITSHSTEAGHEVTKCPRLMESLFSNFLPISWKKVEQTMEDISDVYGVPLQEAMMLLRAICSCGRNITAIMISKHGMMESILCYTALHPKDIQLFLDDAMNLYIESIRTWTVCISYGLACDQFRENFPTFIQNLQKIQDISFKKELKPETSPECKRLCASVKLLEEVIHVAGTTAELHAKMTASAASDGDNMDADSLPPPPINWSHVMGFLPLVTCALSRWTAEIIAVKDTASIKDSYVSLLSSACNLLASFYSKLSSQPSFVPVESLQDIEDLVTTILLPLCTSSFMASMIQNLGSNTASTSVFLPRGIPSLPEYGSLACYYESPNSMNSGTHSEPIINGQAVAFMTSFTRLLCSVMAVHKGIAQKFLPFVTREDLLDYVRKASLKPEVLSQSFFGRFVHHLQYFVIKTFYLVVRSVDVKDLATPFSTCHTAALVVFSRLRSGDEYYAHDLMSTVLFNPDFLPEATEIEATSVAKELSEMNIKSQGRPTPPQLLTSEPRCFTQNELLCEAHGNLLAIKSTYMGSFGKMRHALAASRSLALHQPHDIPSLLLPPSRESLLPADWMFEPIVDLHNQTLSAEMKGRGVDEVSMGMIKTVTCTLQMIQMLEEWRPVSLTSVTMVARVARLMCVFLTGSDLFLDRLVRNYVKSLLHIYTRPESFSQLDFNGKVAGLSSFYDLYISLLSQYSAVSFGDPLFASFLVLPLAQRHHIRFRHALWDEHVSTLRAVSFSVNQVPVPLDYFLYPVEQDDILLYLYLRALSNQDVRPRWCPFFYLVVVHHVNAFIYQRIDPKDTMLLKRKLALLKHVMAVKVDDTRNDLLYYYKPLPDSTAGKAFELFKNLPADREMLLRNREDLQECRKLYENMASTK
ncbi:RNA polymerase II-associated protein 1-like [Actinia tenebrosa]|uniref:RNA polymerase II-associated protein 1-like n=1 Tax=Actinia tenebrosa TaxID=6105 RepID=A0A6P8IIP6_ACTTE|nr:RNA polymerase II-associated protein 1-like [Actinia tenebrosa]